MKKVFKFLIFIVTIVGLLSITAADVNAENNLILKEEVYQVSTMDRGSLFWEFEYLLEIKDYAVTFDLEMVFGYYANNPIYAYDINYLGTDNASSYFGPMYNFGTIYKYDLGVVYRNNEVFAQDFFFLRDDSIDGEYNSGGSFTFNNIVNQYVNYYEIYLEYSYYEEPTPPAIYGPKTYAKNNDTSFDAKDLVPFLTAYDENDGDISNNIYVLTDDYNDSGVPGQYTVIYAVENSNEAVSTFEVTFNVMDVIKPIIYIPTDSFFTTAQVNAMTKQEIINLLVQTGQLDLD